MSALDTMLSDVCQKRTPALRDETPGVRGVHILGQFCLVTILESTKSSTEDERKEVHILEAADPKSFCINCNKPAELKYEGENLCHHCAGPKGAYKETIETVIEAKIDIAVLEKA